METKDANAPAKTASEIALGKLQAGETLLVNAKGVKGGKVQLEFAELIKNPFSKASRSKAAKFNKSDKRFNVASPRRGWMSAEPSDITDILGIDTSSLGEGQIKELNVLNPTDATEGDERLRLEINETVDATDWQKDNLEKSAKKAGPDGDFIMHSGQHIFSNVEIVGEYVKHTFLEPDSNEVAPATAEVSTTEKEADIPA